MPTLLTDFQRRRERAEEHDLALVQGCLVLPGGHLPLVREVSDPILLGVHPARDADEPASRADPAVGHQVRVSRHRVPPYVPRDVHTRVVESLAAGGFVLLIGESTAGKSRLAYEAMRTALPDHVLIAPLHRPALPAAVARASRLPRCVLWLDGMERFLGPDGLTRSSISRLTTGDGHHRVVVGTLRSAEMTRYTDTGTADSAELSEASETLEQAVQLRLARLFTSNELRRARTRAWDTRIADALNCAGNYGLAEYLAAGPELLGDWLDAWDVANHPRAAALVTAAVDCRRAGLTRPLPRSLLESLHEAYLRERGGSRLRPETPEEAWSWATRQRRATTALLVPAGGPGVTDGPVDVFDYLVDAGQKRATPETQVPERVFSAALPLADASEAVRLASTAHEYGLYAIGAQAYGRALQEYRDHLGALHPKTLTSQSSLAVMLRQLGRLSEAEQCARTAVEAMADVFGADHPETLTAGNYHAACLFDLGRLEEAEAGHRTVLATRTLVLGPEHPHTLSSRNDLALVLCEMGRLREAEAQHRVALDTRTRLLGPEHPDTLSSRSSFAGLLRRLGRFVEAEQEHASVLEARRRTLGDEHPKTLTSRANRASLLRRLGSPAEAEHEHTAVLEVRRRTLGDEHPRTLTSRNNLALVFQDLGRLEAAEREHRVILRARVRVLGPDHPKTKVSRRNLARVLRELEREDDSDDV
ncbi:tetratricopeptide repeat protein [Streptomyces sp. NPDC002698]|uniref:tetratricopeptide repeat protein n=1 Tax=Streptomyces sp. NPDC002698 TaxID=3364660 RepID=UPI00369BB3AE